MREKTVALALCVAAVLSSINACLRFSYPVQSEAVSEEIARQVDCVDVKVLWPIVCGSLEKAMVTGFVLSDLSTIIVAVSAVVFIVTKPKESSPDAQG